MLIFNYGAMNSAKTVNLICKAYELKQKNMDYLCIKPHNDNRFSESKIVSRAGLEIDAIPILDSSHLQKILEDKRGLYKYILVDEVQFFDTKSIDLLMKYSVIDDINVLCYGLMTDFQTNLFPASKCLVEYADELYHIKSYCSCGNIATVNARIDSSRNIITSGNQVEIGAENNYITLCKKCYFQQINDNQ